MQEIQKIKQILSQIDKEKSSAKKQDLIVQILKLLIIIQ